MRPKKVILLAISDEQLIGELAYLLKIHAFRVVAVETLVEANRAVESQYYDLLIAGVLMRRKTQGKMESAGEKLIAAAKARWGFRPALLIAGKTQEVSALYAADCVLREPYRSLELLEKIRQMTARKRGPRKGVAKAPALEPRIEVAV